MFEKQLQIHKIANKDQVHEWKAPYVPTKALESIFIAPNLLTVEK